MNNNNNIQLGNNGYNFGEPSNTVIDAINNQKDIQTFLNELEEKYFEENNSLLNNFGKYLNRKFTSFNNSYNSYNDMNYYLKDSYYKPTVKNLDYYQKKICNF